MKAHTGLGTYKVQPIPDRNFSTNREDLRRDKEFKSDFSQKSYADDDTYELSRFSSKIRRKTKERKKVKVLQGIYRVAKVVFL